MENIDTFTEPKGFKIAPQPELIEDWTADNRYDGSFVLYTKYAKKLSISFIGHYWFNGAYVGKIPNCDVFYQAVEFQDKIVFAYLNTNNGTLSYGYWPVDSSGNIGTVQNPDAWSLDAAFGQYTVVLHNFNDALLLFGAGSRLFKIEGTLLTDPEGMTNPVLDGNDPLIQFRQRDNIIAITQYLEQFKIYCVYGDKDHPTR